MHIFNISSPPFNRHLECKNSKTRLSSLGVILKVKNNTTENIFFFRYSIVWSNFVIYSRCKILIFPLYQTFMATYKQSWEQRFHSDHCADSKYSILKCVPWHQQIDFPISQVQKVTTRCEHHFHQVIKQVGGDHRARPFSRSHLRPRSTLVSSHAAVSYGGCIFHESRSSRSLNIHTILNLLALPGKRHRSPLVPLPFTDSVFQSSKVCV